MANKTHAPANNSVLAGPTLVVRRMHPNLTNQPLVMEDIALTELEQEVKEGELLYFSEGWVANDHPRDLWLSEELLAGTEKLREAGETELFGVARTDTGAIVKTFRTLASAEAASKGARLELGVSVEIEDEEGETVTNVSREPVPAEWA